MSKVQSGSDIASGEMSITTHTTFYKMLDGKRCVVVPEDTWTKIQKLISSYPKCADCPNIVCGMCTVPIVDYHSLENVDVACPKDKVYLKLRKAVGE